MIKNWFYGHYKTFVQKFSHKLHLLHNYEHVSNNITSTKKFELTVVDNIMHKFMIKFQ